MGSCTRRHFLLSTCFLQMMTIIERQVFDFLGYMWAPIFVNFFHILFIIFGFYGAYHFRIKYIITYLVWNFLWIGWNSFLICFYLNMGTLDKDSDLLNLGTGSVSWFEVNGYGCKPIYNTNITSEDPYRPIRPESVDDCLITYDIVEVVHSGVQCVLSFLGILGAILISYIFLDEDDRLKHINKKSKHRQSLYSIEFGPSLDTIRSRADTILDYGDDKMHERCGGSLEGDNAELSPKPMTPRRVKRRSVMHRGSNSRQSTASRRSSGHTSHKNTLRSEGGGGGAGSGAVGSTGTHSRSSTRGSRRKYHQNPVTKLLDQQQKSTMHIHGHHPKQTAKQQFGSFHRQDTAPALTASNLQSLNQSIHNNINAVSSSAAGGSLTKTNNNHYQSFRKNIPPDPIYYNTNAQTAYLQQQQWQQMQQSPSPVNTLEEPQSPTLTLTPSLGGGHYNPTYQHSTTNLNDGEQADELYNNRPPSVRSSYSNFHGARPMSSYMPSSNNTENVFVSLVASNTAQNSTTQHPASSPGTSSSSYHQQQPQPQPQPQPQQQQPQQLPHESPSTPPLYQQHPLHQHSLSQHSLPPPPPLPDPPYTSSQPQPIPFHKRTASRESIRSMAFLNSGPPAYNLNYHTPPDSETTM